MATEGEIDLYFPPSVAENLKFESLVIKTIDIQEKKHFVIRQIEVTDTVTSYKHIVEHVHFLSWSDF